MPEDIRNKSQISNEDIIGLNFVRAPGCYVFRKYYKQGLRSQILEVLDQLVAACHKSFDLGSFEVWCQAFPDFHLFETLQALPEAPLALADRLERVVQSLGGSEATAAIDEPQTPVRIDEEVAKIAVPVRHEIVEDLHDQALLVPTPSIRWFDLPLPGTLEFTDGSPEPDADATRVPADIPQHDRWHPVQSEQAIQLVGCNIVLEVVVPVE